MKKKNHINVGIVRFPASSAGAKPLSNLIMILSAFLNKVYVISGNQGFKFITESKNIKIFRVDHHSGKNSVTQIAMYLITQLKMSYGIIKENDAKKYIFFWSGFLLVPFIVGILLKKNISIALMGEPAGFKKDVKNHNFILELCFALSDSIILYSDSLIEKWGLDKFRKKIKVAQEHFLDLNTFSVTIPVTERPQLIGYIGRLSGEKGVQNFPQAINELRNKQVNLRVIIGGEGELKEPIEKTIREMGLNNYVDILGWISHDDLPRYLNQLRLLVLPSYTEGLPNIMLEAMACGTPVLATQVGAIPDIIKDGITGFLMENNSPKCIAEHTKRALNHPHLEEISMNGRNLVENEFTFERAVNCYRKIFDE